MTTPDFPVLFEYFIIRTPQGSIYSKPINSDGYSTLSYWILVKKIDILECEVCSKQIVIIPPSMQLYIHAPGIITSGEDGDYLIKVSFVCCSKECLDEHIKDFKDGSDQSILYRTLYAIHHRM